MAFTTLEERFNKAVNQLYAGANTKFDNGVPTTRATAEPFITRRPGSSQLGIKTETRSTPVVSSLQDVRRLSLFQVSSRGILFLLKQQLLQTGNTFEATRLLNPTFVIGNAIPFIHAKRALDVPITARGIGRQLLGNSALANRIFGKGGINKGDVSSTNRGDLLKIGQLQQETYDKFEGSPTITSFIKKIPVIGKVVSAANAKRSVGDGARVDREKTRPELGRTADRYIVLRNTKKHNAENLKSFSPIRTLQQSLGVTVSTNSILDASPNAVLSNVFGMFNPINPPSPQSVGPINRQTTTAKNKTSEFIIKYGILNERNYTTYLEFSNDKPKWTYRTNSSDYKSFANKNYKSFDPLKEYEAVTENTTIKESALAQEYNQSGTALEWVVRTSGSLQDRADLGQFIKYFSAGNAGLSSVSSEQLTDGSTTNMRKKIAAITQTSGKGVKLSYLRDPLNNPAESTGVKSVYKNLPTVNTVKNSNNQLSDIITVAFAIGKDEPIQFRAFITNLVENTVPTYNEYQYIGRIEKFISYTTVQRSISFKLAVIAYSKDELTQVWKRLNYLTGFAFPYGVNKGLFQPNIIRLTIGDVYVDQPGYIQTINTNFSGITDSWNIERIEDDKTAELPISAMVDMQFILIEKTGFRTVASPFYGITEGLEEFKTPISTRVTNTSPTTQPPAPAVVEPSQQSAPTEQTQPNLPTTQVPATSRPQVPVRLEQLTIPNVRVPADNTRVTPARTARPPVRRSF